MYILMGAGLLTGAALLMSWAIGAFRRPDASAWTEYESISVAISLVVSTLLAFGVGFLAAGLANLGSQMAEVGVAAVGGAAALLLFAAWASPRLWAPANRPGGAGEVVAMPPRGKPTGSQPRRKAA